MDRTHIELTDGEITRLRTGEQVQTQQALDPQPPATVAVKKRCGVGFSIYRSHGRWWIGGPVGLVRDMGYTSKPSPPSDIGEVMAVQGSTERCRVVAVEAGEVDSAWMWTTTVETTTPAEPGWYWFRWNDRAGEHVAWVGPSSITPRALTVSFVGIRASMSVEDACKRGEWLGVVAKLESAT